MSAMITEGGDVDGDLLSQLLELVVSYVYTAVVGGFCLALLKYFMFTFPAYPEDRVKAVLERCRANPIAHRGGSDPENTLAAIRRAKERGLTVAEVDVWYTKDGHPVVLHDHTVDRTSNGTGDIREMTLEEVKRLDFGSKFG